MSQLFFIFIWLPQLSCNNLVKWGVSLFLCALKQDHDL